MKKKIIVIATLLLSACGPSKAEIEAAMKAQDDSLKKSGVAQPIIKGSVGAWDVVPINIEINSHLYIKTPCSGGGYNLIHDESCKAH